MKPSIKPLSVIIVMILVIAQSISTQTLAQGGWKTVKTLIGSGDRDSEDFMVPTNYWRIMYTVVAQTEQYAGFSVYVYSAGMATGYVANVNFDKSGTEASYVNAGPGDFWIHVRAANLRSWMIEVQIQQ
jgi:hypothetical protein